MKKLLLLILFLLPLQTFSGDINYHISHVEDICMQNEGFYEISQEEPLRNKQVRILSGIKNRNKVYFVKNSGSINNYPFNFRFAYLWHYDCIDHNYQKLNNQNLFSILKNGTYQVRGINNNSIIIGIYRDTVAIWDFLSYDINSQNFIQLN